MKLYSVSLSPRYGWLMYSGSLPVFTVVLDVLHERLPELGELPVRSRRADGYDDGLHLDLLALSADQYRAALEILAEHLVPRTREMLEHDTSAVTAAGTPLRPAEALGDAKTVALIARNVLARHVRWDVRTGGTAGWRPLPGR